MYLWFADTYIANIYSRDGSLLFYTDETFVRVAGKSRSGCGTEAPERSDDRGVRHSPADYLFIYFKKCILRQ